MSIKTLKNKIHFNLVTVAALSILSISFQCYAETNATLNVNGDLFIAGAAAGVAGIALATSHSSHTNSAPVFSETIIPCNPQPTAQCNTTCISDLQKMLDDFRVENNIPGMQMTISTGSQAMQTFCSGTTTMNGTTHVGRNSLFEIGSITKSFISTIILQLEAEGKLSLDDKVSKWFPQYTDWSNITIKQLLNMTGGIFGYDDDQFLQQVAANHLRYWSMNEITNSSYAHNPNTLFLPGKGWDYSNTQYTLAGMIIEMVTHKSVQENLLERILIPLGLHNTIYNDNLNPSNLPLMAHGYWEIPEVPIFVKNQDLTDINTSVYNSGGAIISTSEDVVKWLRTLFSGRVLKLQQFKEMTTLVCDGSYGDACIAGTELPNDTALGGYALGLTKLPADFNGLPDPLGRNVWQYTGGAMGYITEYIYSLDKDLSIAITTDVMSYANIFDLMLAVNQYLYPNGFKTPTKIFLPHLPNGKIQNLI